MDDSTTNSRVSVSNEIDCSVMTTSPFFEKEKILENEVGFVVYDGFPVSEGHCLIVPHRVYPDYFDSTEEEIIGLQNIVIQTKEYLDEKYKPNEYNEGINCGEVGGQTSAKRSFFSQF